MTKANAHPHAGSGHDVQVPGIVSWTQLQSLCAPTGPRPTRAAVRRWADARGIRYMTDRNGGLFTTVEALNLALGLGTGPRIEDLMP